MRWMEYKNLISDIAAFPFIMNNKNRKSQVTHGHDEGLMFEAQQSAASGQQRHSYNTMIRIVNTIKATGSAAFHRQLHKNMK
jgi:hypothetical protein